ncbi:hypothetical protein QQ020_17270 [Fulvivirgaceae bacterium BMA12]|uniref:Septum formation inhibitor Maf n=1 Tax=Agaribacillus aureus TaxID=3051825 RepID=A0ABT8LC09_9BACT|nr:hypothetical protein [Fulvivirgaceae bacterium BMA12]
MKLVKNYLMLMLGILLINCQGKAQPDFSAEPLQPQKFNNYWFAGKAELTSYHLTQSRYGKLHEGNAVLIFVTEDFSRGKQVKLDDPIKNRKDAIKVMKLNFTKKFNTGIYPYSMMSSCFTPVDRENNPHSIKLTTSSQEWCGHTFTQVNLGENNYEVSGYSYFESEGDKQKKLAKTVLEDELWNLIRLSPDQLPVGKVKIIPGTFSARLMHNPLENTEAIASLTENQNPTFGKEGIMEYKIDYKGPKRTLKIYFESSFPYGITGWEETYKGIGGKQLTSQAIKNKSILLDYWTKNKPGDTSYRQELGLE